MTPLLINAMGDFYPIFMMGLRSSMLAAIGDQTFHILPSVKTGVGFIVGIHDLHRAKATSCKSVDLSVPPIRLNIMGEYRESDTRKRVLH